MDLRRKRQFARRSVILAMVFLSVYVVARYKEEFIPEDILRSASNASYQALRFETFYNDVKCISEHSNKTCSFPLLTDYHRRCGYFPGSTSWLNVGMAFPLVKMEAQICTLPPVTSAPERLREYITDRNISGIVIFGDSQGQRYRKCFMAFLKDAGFDCKTLVKSEPPGDKIHLNYYTEGSLFTPNDTVKRTCRTCNSALRVCSGPDGRKVAVEYLSMLMSSSTPLGGHCNDSSHPLCQPTSQQEYVLKHYLARENKYPQLLLLFSTFAHDRNTPLAATYDGIMNLYGLIRRYVPSSSAVIWYNAPGYHEIRHRQWYTSEGAGYSPNDKMQAVNDFLSKVQLQHHEEGNTPPMYSFFDLYHTQEQLRGAWVGDHVHSRYIWYNYIMGYTAAMLPSLPMA